jgi:hypothetical protein
VSTSVNDPSRIAEATLTAALEDAKRKQALFPDDDDDPNALLDGVPLSNALVQTLNRAVQSVQRLDAIS